MERSKCALRPPKVSQKRTSFHPYVAYIPLKFKCFRLWTNVCHSPRLTSMTLATYSDLWAYIQWMPNLFSIGYILSTKLRQFTSGSQTFMCAYMRPLCSQWFICIVFFLVMKILYERFGGGGGNTRSCTHMAWTLKEEFPPYALNLVTSLLHIYPN